MIQLDDQFLDDVGLGDLPAAQRSSLLQHIYEELELRVGTALSEGLSDFQLEEFEAIIDRDHGRIVSWLDEHAPNFLDDPVYRRMTEALADTAQPADIVCEYAATKWLEVNRPDYRDIVAAVLAEVKVELRRGNARVLAAGAAGQSDQVYS